MSYSAIVRVPSALTALMSAVPVDHTNGKGGAQGGTARVGHRGLGKSILRCCFAAGVPHLSDVIHTSPTRLFAFEQKVPIPPYLIALAVGQLESRELSDRCGGSM